MDPDDVTPEMRQAVYAADCKLNGHLYDTSGLLQPVPNPNGFAPIYELGAYDPDEFPAIKCSRCGQVWIVLPVAGEDYEDAERKLFTKVKPNDAIAKEIPRMRGRREAAKVEKRRKNKEREDWEREKERLEQEGNLDSPTVMTTFSTPEEDRIRAELKAARAAADPNLTIRQ